MSLRRIVHAATGDAIHNCQACFDYGGGRTDGMGIPSGSLIQLALLDDEEALPSRTLRSDLLLETARGACRGGLDLHAVMVTLREEAKRKARTQNLRRKT